MSKELVTLPEGLNRKVNAAARHIVDQTTLAPSQVSAEMAQALEALKLAQDNYLDLIRKAFYA